MTYDSVPPIAPVPDLSDLTGLPSGPPPVANALENLNAWDGRGMSAHQTALARRTANRAAERAGQIQSTGLGIREWHNSFHAAVVSSLAAAETNAPEAERGWHADRLDAYAAAYGLRGWYRHTDFRGRHAVQVNLIRTHADGDRGRYFTTDASSGGGFRPGPYRASVVDRDSHRVVYRAISVPIARQWVEQHESGDAEGVASQCPTGSARS
ncbi:hypothetical protein [Streptomyces sp. MMBL 11-1]|uniref:hypothetical protein n=1 Tax=Streptomyces sp. MMBL 11-1 TaxID=3026420 RepID=UPI00235F18A7|nr:hypothetical protein [Streptomyces sp. MMBL 11-1]